MSQYLSQYIFLLKRSLGRKLPWNGTLNEKSFRERTPRFPSQINRKFATAGGSLPFGKGLKVI